MASSKKSATASKQAAIGKTRESRSEKASLLASCFENSANPSLKFVGIRDTKARLSEMLRGAEESDCFIITSHGKPRAMLLPFSEADLEEFVLANRQGFIERRQQARREIASGANGTLEDLDELIED